MCDNKDNSIEQKNPNLWNPNAAANWSLLFTPIFGAWLHAINWKELNQPDLAKKSMIWVYIGIVVLIISLFLQPIGLIYIIIWYFVNGKKQIKYIKENNINYNKKPWLKVLLISFVIYSCIIMGLYIINKTIFTTYSDIGLVKNGVLDLDKSLSVGEAFENYKYFTNVKWESFKTENGRKVVQVNGRLDLNSYPLGKEWKENGIKDAYVIFQFLILKDGEHFQIQTYGIKLVYNDSEEKILDASDMGLTQIQMLNNLQQIYDNEPLT